MFADRVESKNLVLLQIELEGIVCRRGVKAVRPESLIEQAKLKDESAVEQRTQDVVHHSHRNRAHTEVAADSVAATEPAERDAQLIEERILGTPQTRVRDRYVNDFAGVATDVGNLRGSSEDDHADVLGEEPDAAHDQIKLLARDVRRHLELGDVSSSGGLEPDGLPDPRRARVEDVVRTSALLAQRNARFFER